MSLNLLPLPQPGQPPPPIRSVVWPTGLMPQPWVCLWPTPSLVKTHWCPGASEPNAKSRGRTAACWPTDCPRCEYPKRYPPERRLVFPCMTPQGRAATLLLPEHVVYDVQAHPAYRGTWLRASLLLSRAHLGPNGAVVLVGLDYHDGGGLPPAPDHLASVAKLWAWSLPASDDARLAVEAVPGRGPGQEG